MKRRLWIALLCGGALAINALAIWKWGDRGGRSGLQDRYTAGEPPRGDDMVELHRQRAVGAIADVKQEDIDELVNNLVDDSYYHYPGVPSSVEQAQECWRLVLSNRRLLRLVDELQDLAQAERQKTVSEAFQSTLQRHQAVIERVIQSYEDPGQPKNEDSMLATQLGLCSSLFLVARFQTSADLIRRVREVQTFADRIDKRLKQSPSVPDPVEYMIRHLLQPDNAFYVSVVLSITDKAEWKKLLADSGLSEMGNVEQVEITAWDAEPGSFDFAHTRLGVPVDARKKAVKRPVFQWNGHHLMDTDGQQAAVQRLLEKVEQRA